MLGKHIVGIVGIIVAGAIVIALLFMHPWRHEDNWRHDRFDHQTPQSASFAGADQTTINQPVNTPITQEPSSVATPVVAPPQPIYAPGAVDASGQALTVTFPTETEVEVYRDNIWVPARIERREQGRVFVRYDDRGGPVTEWVGPTRVRSLHDRDPRFHR